MRNNNMPWRTENGVEKHLKSQWLGVGVGGWMTFSQPHNLIRSIKAEEAWLTAKVVWLCHAGWIHAWIVSRKTSVMSWNDWHTVSDNSVGGKACGSVMQTPAHNPCKNALCVTFYHYAQDAHWKEWRKWQETTPCTGPSTKVGPPAPPKKGI